MNGTRGVLKVYDLPGLGDSLENNEQYLNLYKRILPRADSILCVHPAADRMVAYLQQNLQRLFGRSGDLEKISSKLVFGLNKVDQIGPTDWNTFANIPSPDQATAIRERIQDFDKQIKRALPKWKGSVVAYSALMRYRLPALFKALMMSVSEERRWVLSSRMDLASFDELVDKNLMSAVLEESRGLDVVNSQKFNRSTPAITWSDTQNGDSVANYINSLSEQEYLQLVFKRQSLIEFIQARIQEEHEKRKPR